MWVWLPIAGNRDGKIARRFAIAPDWAIEIFGLELGQTAIALHR
ncbi:hypothetical protein PN466_07770 [Roseofilum reptotaenium CS-1145]|nr:hypothetical protein [Roseofilum reptotaenium]MDB9516842.1 hypothetical protein [Roseofilum reptotaenium CS-1145]